MHHVKDELDTWAGPPGHRLSLSVNSAPRLDGRPGTSNLADAYSMREDVGGEGDRCSGPPARAKHLSRWLRGHSSQTLPPTHSPRSNSLELPSRAPRPGQPAKRLTEIGYGGSLL
jgi:hypothetical protein